MLRVWGWRGRILYFPIYEYFHIFHVCWMWYGKGDERGHSRRYGTAARTMNKLKWIWFKDIWCNYLQLFTFIFQLKLPPLASIAFDSYVSLPVSPATFLCSKCKSLEGYLASSAFPCGKSEIKSILFILITRTLSRGDSLKSSLKNTWKLNELTSLLLEFGGKQHFLFVHIFLK